MQYDGCFPGYYSTMDLNMDANSSTWPLNNINKMLEHGHHYNGFLPPFSADQVLGYNKEVLKQMMLKHETMFRDQVSAISTSSVNRNRVILGNLSNFNKTIDP